jgi:hypothetical protein
MILANKFNNVTFEDNYILKKNIYWRVFFKDFKKAYDSVRREALTVFSLSLASQSNWKG